MTMIHWRDVVTPGEVFHTARDTKTRRHPLRYHGHDFAEVFWIDAGHGTHQINGSNLPLSPGSLVLMRPTDFHGIEPLPGESLRLTNIAFPSESCAFLGQRYFSKPWGFWTHEELPAHFQVEPSQLNRFNRWADTLAHAPRERLHIERFLLNLLDELTARSAESLPEQTPDWLLHACREIKAAAHFSKGAPEFFRLAGRSREHVARSMRQCMGTTPTSYVNKVRMQYAARQLEMSSRSILEIALDCGLQNLSHFYTLFHAEFGMSPRAYRTSRIRSI